MSVDISFGGTATGNINEGFHISHKDCYPPTESESDGEESFVVLSEPESSFIGVVEAFLPGTTSSSPNHQSLASAIDRSQNVLNEIARNSVSRSTYLSDSKHESNDPTIQATKSVSTMAQSVGLEASPNAGVIKVNGLELDLDLIQTRVQLFSTENAQLKEVLKQNNIAMEDQCRKIVLLQERYKSTIDQAASNLQKALGSVEQLKAENEELTFVRVEQKKVINQLQTDIILVNKNKAELQASKKALDNLSVVNMKSFDLESTERKLTEATASYKITLEKINELQTKLNISETQFESLKYKHLEEIAKFKEKLFNFEEREDYYLQNESAQKTMKSQMSETQMRIVEMTTRMNDLVTRNSVLEEQLKIYITDFEEERDARRKIKQEQNQLKEDLDFTRTLNEELKVENARLKTPNAPPKPRAKSPVKEVYVCHWCQFGFFNFNALENHTRRCPAAFEQIGH